MSTPSKDLSLRSQHDRAMVDWAKKSADQGVICGHTHQAVFESMTKIDRMQNELNDLRTEIESKVQGIKEMDDL